MAVAARLKTTLRDADTIGRMGGDEFVVLIEGGGLNVSPKLVAERLLDVMRQPFAVDGAAAPLLVNTSIGIAVGDRASAGELLRDADVALYEAKTSGWSPSRSTTWTISASSASRHCCAGSIPRTASFSLTSSSRSWSRQARSVR